MFNSTLQEKVEFRENPEIQHTKSALIGQIKHTWASTALLVSGQLHHILNSLLKKWCKCDIVMSSLLTRWRKGKKWKAEKVSFKWSCNSFDSSICFIIYNLYVLQFNNNNCKLNIFIFFLATNHDDSYSYYTEVLHWLTQLI